MLWNTNSFQLVSSSCDFSITCFLQSIEGIFFWAFSGIYGLHYRANKLLMVEELGSIRDGWFGPWCIRGISMKSYIFMKGALLLAILMPWLSFGILLINRPWWTFLYGGRLHVVKER